MYVGVIIDMSSLASFVIWYGSGYENVWSNKGR